VEHQAKMVHQDKLEQAVYQVLQVKTEHQDK
jgi:hypothetical protein